MALWIFVLVPMIVLSQSGHAVAIDENDLHKVMADMRAESYHGFVILLKLLDAIPYHLQRSRELTFLMLDDRALSAAELTSNSLQDFILRHSIPTGFSLHELMRLPNGTLVPTGVPKNLISIINSKSSQLMVNNARIVKPNVCRSSMVRCHGISSELWSGDDITAPSASHPFSLLSRKPKGSRMRNQTIPSSDANRQRSALLN